MQLTYYVPWSNQGGGREHVVKFNIKDIIFIKSWVSNAYKHNQKAEIDLKWTHYVGLKYFNNHITSKQTVEGTESDIELDSVLLILF